MEINFFQKEQLEECADLLMQAYNCAPWDDHWTKETAIRCLSEFCSCSRFVGFTISESGAIVGAAFCHERTWWTNDELYIDEFFIAPSQQRKGYGQALLKHIEGYIKERKLAGFTLLTNKYMPAPNFYRKNGFAEAEHVIFMYKVV